MKSLWTIALLLGLAACNPLDHPHSQQPSHTSPHPDAARHRHADHPPGHHHEQAHGHIQDHRPEQDQAPAHADEPTLAITHFSDETELFLEFPALVVGRESAFLAHLTRLQDFTPVTRGVLTVALIGGGVPDELFRVEAPAAPGIFRPLVIPQHGGRRQVILNLKADALITNHDLGEFTVYASAQEALGAIPQEREPEHAIHYLKEQQWQVDFATAPVQQRVLRASIPATGTLRPRADGEVYLSAAAAGHVHKQGDFPYPGMPVEAGQQLASIIPRLAADSDVSTLRAALDKARTRYNLAEHERARLQRLWRDQVIALHRLHEAESALEVAKAELEAAERRYEQSTGEKSRINTGIPVLAPIGGVLAHVDVAPGRYVAEGEPLFHIVNVDRLWLEARIAEADIGRLQLPDGAWFTVEGFERTFNTFELDGRLVGLGGAVDPSSRTTPLIFEFDNPDQRLRSGMFAQVRVFTGETRTGLTVPVSAVFDDAGQEVVYVMLDGETFQRRVVRLGIRETDRVQVLSGVAPGERVVSEGAYLLRLASAAPAEAGHGHAH